MTTATITSTKGTHTGTVADCLAWLRARGGASARLIIGDHLLHLVGEVVDTLAFEVEGCDVECPDGFDDDRTRFGIVVALSESSIDVALDDCSRVQMSIESLTDGTLIPFQA